MTRTPFVLVSVLGAPLIIGAVNSGPTAFDLIFHRRPPERFLIPNGYSGWVRIDLRQKGAPPLPIENGRLPLEPDEHGTLRTSSDPKSGHGRDDFFYYSGDHHTPLSNDGVCKGGMVWQIETLVDEPTSTPFAHFFVSTEDQYRHEGDPAGK